MNEMKIARGLTSKCSLAGVVIFLFLHSDFICASSFDNPGGCQITGFKIVIIQVKLIH